MLRDELCLCIFITKDTIAELYFHETKITLHTDPGFYLTEVPSFDSFIYPSEQELWFPFFILIHR